MRIMLDTNVLISMLVFESFNAVIDKITQKHSIVLCSYVIDELHEVIERKFPDRQKDIEKFLMKLPFELVYTPKTIEEHDLFKIRDVDDEKVLYSAIIADVDILLTGDKDFSDIEIEKPEILTPGAFLEKY